MLSRRQNPPFTARDGRSGRYPSCSTPPQNFTPTEHSDTAPRPSTSSRRLGHHIHRRTRPGKSAGIGTESLTEREHQVAGVIVDRKTNPEIAAELFLTPKTVETHIRNMLRKLDVDSRIGIARAVQRADREDYAPRQ